MRLHRLRLINYRGVAECDVSFSTNGVTIVEGPNEVGKTSLSEALQLAIDLPDSSRHARVTSVKPVGSDKAPEVEIILSSGNYKLVYHKRWLQEPATTLEVKSPRGESLTGRRAHDRVQEILEETLDADLWRALRLDQGTELAMPLFDLPSMGRALDRAAGGDLTTSREDTLRDRISEEYAKYWTRTGQPRAEVKSLERTAVEAKDDVDELSRKLEEIEHDTDRMSKLVGDASSLDLSRKASEIRESELTESWESTQRLLDEVGRLTAISDSAIAKRDRAADEKGHQLQLIDTANERNRDLASLEARAEQAAPALEAATLHHDEATADLDTAQAALRSSESAQRLANEDSNHLRRQMEVAQLRERHDRYVQAEKVLKKAEAFLESATLDDTVVGSIAQAYLDYERAKAGADSAAASVKTTALRDVTVHVDGDAVELDTSEVHHTLVDHELVLEIPNIARICVSAGAEARGLAQERVRTREAYRRLCDEAKVANISEARTAAQQRREEERNREEALTAIEQSLRDLTADVLLDKVNELSKQVACYPQGRPHSPALPSDFDEANRVASELDRSLNLQKATYRACEDSANKASAALHAAQVCESVLAARIRDACGNRDAAVADLAQAREIATDEALAGALALAQQRADQARESLEDSEARLNTQDRDSLRGLLENAGEATKRAIDHLQSNQDDQNRLRISLDLRGEQGLHTDRAEALDCLRHVEREHASTKARAEAVRLLYDTFAKHRQRARQRYLEPFKAGIDQLGRIVFGSTFAVELNDDLGVARRTLDGITLDANQLSTGAREQLGVISRLACAAIVSVDDGGAPVMIDDALGWSDPQRLQGMGAAITAAGKQCQVIVLTCSLGRYSHVGSARVVTLNARCKDD